MKISIEKVEKSSGARWHLRLDDSPECLLSFQSQAEVNTFIELLHARFNENILNSFWVISDQVLGSFAISLFALALIDGDHKDRYFVVEGLVDQAIPDTAQLDFVAVGQ